MGCSETKKTKKSVNSQNNSQKIQNSQILQNSQNPQNPQYFQNPYNSQNPTNMPKEEERKEPDNQRNESNVPITQEKKIIEDKDNLFSSFNNNPDKDKDNLHNPNPNFNKAFINGSIIDNKIKNNSNEEYIPNSIGKLCFDPLSLFVYDSKKNSFHVQKFDLGLNNFEELNNTSSCCNGDNKLFVSGGSTKTGEIIDKMWAFDLDDYSVEGPFQIEGKINHSMIYILDNTEKYIFFVGGNTENVFKFDIKTYSINSWGKLKKNRIEPALIEINNYLYAFDNINESEDINNSNLTFERSSFHVSSMPYWELIKPDLSPQISDTKFNPKFFGVAKESDDNIIFLGGSALDDNDNKNYKYNPDNNLIELSEVPFVNITLKEKKFFNYNNKNNVFFILPDFYKKCPQVVFYIKNKNMLKIVDYKPKLRNEIEKKIEMENPDLNRVNFGPKNYDFNMPKNVEKVENEIVEI